MPFRNDIAGGNGALVRNWLQSDNYVAGTTGWRISKNGNAEFNNGTFRGSIEVGSLSGQHFWVNNPNTGDVIDIYDSSANLVFSIDGTGTLTALNPSGTPNLLMQIEGPQILFNDTSINLNLFPSVSGASTLGSPNTAQLWLQSGAAFPSAADMQLLLVGDANGNQYTHGNQHGLQGSLIQNDQLNVNCMMHAQLYSNIVTDASGNSNFAHNCGFTPHMGFLVSASTAGSDFYQYVWLNPAFGATNANAHFTDRLGAPKVSTTLAMTYGIFFG